MASNAYYASSDEVKTGYGPMFLLLVAFGVLALIVAGLVVHSSGDEAIHVYYRISVARSCLELDGKYQDIRLGKAVSVYNKKSQILGTGPLEVQFASKGRCDYSALFTIKRSHDRTYKVSTGSKFRGELKFSDEDLVILKQGRTLVVSASLN